MLEDIVYIDLVFAMDIPSDPDGGVLSGISFDGGMFVPTIIETTPIVEVITVSNF